jgi:hypothetical protein
MPVESAADHPTYNFGGNTVTSLIAPSRGEWSVPEHWSRRGRDLRPVPTISPPRMLQLRTT